MANEEIVNTANAAQAAAPTPVAAPAQPAVPAAQGSSPVPTTPEAQPAIAPAVAPVAEPAQAPQAAAPQPEGSVPATPAPVAASSDAKAATAAPGDTLLGKEEPKPAPTIPDPTKATTEGAPKPDNEGGQTAEPAPPPTYEPFVLPDDVKLDESKVGDFTKLLTDLELTGKAEHAAVQQFGQKAVEFYVAEMKKNMEDYNKSVMAQWDKQKTDWKEAFLKDPDMGGNRAQTTVDAARSFIRVHGGTPEQQAEFRNVMEATGLGNHPAVIRLLANAYRDLAEGKPLAASQPVPAPKSKTQTLYGKS